MTRRYGVWMLVLMLTVAAGCSSNRSANHRDQPRYTTPRGSLIGPNAVYDLGYRARWVTNLKLRNGRTMRAAKVLDDLLVTVAMPGNLVTATSMRNGEVQWTVTIGGGSEKLFTPIRYEDAIYVNSETHIYELDVYTGEVRGNAPLVEPVVGGPVLIEDRAIFGSINGTVFAHSLVSGRQRWMYRLTARIVSPPTAVGLNVFASDANGVYAMLSAKDGTMQWQGRTFEAVTVPPAVDRVNVYVASRDSFLYALDRSTGSDKWKYAAATPLNLPAEAIGLGVYMPISGQGLVALDSVNGGLRWKLEKPAYPITVQDDNLIAATQHSIMLIETDSGRIVRTVPTDTLANVITGPDDSLLLFSPTGKIVRIDPL